ncbi:MAG TPA: thiaminase II [Porphyromonadaceae bacterium]|nr:thiaminase II [Porphyromonadaceae bacterium]
MEKWSEKAWKEVEPIYRAILDHPFVSELAEGTLSHERFLFYIRQDSLYIANYCRVLAHIASRLTDTDQTEDFLRFAADGVAVERALHQSFLTGDEAPATPTPTCALYCRYEKSCGLEPVEVEAAAILPCFWVYQRVGCDIMARSNPGNPYSAWIATYADPAFEASTRRAIEICDTLAENASGSVRHRMTEAFVDCTRMEWMFWDSAYNLEKWKI